MMHWLLGMVLVRTSVMRQSASSFCVHRLSHNQYPVSEGMSVEVRIRPSVSQHPSLNHLKRTKTTFSRVFSQELPEQHKPPLGTLVIK